VLTATINIFSSHLLAIINNVSVWWHVVGALVVIGILWIIPDQHWSASDVFTGHVNNTGGLFGGDTGGFGFWFYVLPLGFLLTQYTITGYDASAHLSEETHAAADSAAKGIWQSIFYSAIGGYILLLTFLFAVQDPEGVSAGGGGVQVIFDQALGAKWAGVVLLIAASGQFYCTTACLTSCTRMMYAFSRDGAMPGAQYWSRLNSKKVPVNAVLLTAVVGIILTLPALIEINIGTPEEPIIVNYAFLAVVSIGVIGLYLAFAIPIWLRWRVGSAFKQGPWNLGTKWKWMAPLAVAEIVITSIYFIMPFTPAGAPGFMRGFLGAPSTAEVPFDWKFVNYTPFVTGGALLLLWIGWHLSAKKWFTGPKRTVDLPAGVPGAEEIALEHFDQGYLPGPHQGKHPEDHAPNE
jgi:amino acid transporter